MAPPKVFDLDAAITDDLKSRIDQYCSLAKKDKAIGSTFIIAACEVLVRPLLFLLNFVTQARNSFQNSLPAPPHVLAKSPTALEFYKDYYAKVKEAGETCGFANGPAISRVKTNLDSAVSLFNADNAVNEALQKVKESAKEKEGKEKEKETKGKEEETTTPTTHSRGKASKKFKESKASKKRKVSSDFPRSSFVPISIQTNLSRQTRPRKKMNPRKKRLPVILTLNLSTATATSQ